MKIALFGASGMIGQRILNEAVSRGHNVTAIVRNPSKVDTTSPAVTALAGNILDPKDVAATVAGHDAVVSAYGPSHDTPETVIDSVRSLAGGLQEANVRRLVVVGGAGSLEVAPGVQLVDTPEFPAAWKAVALAHRDALAALKADGGNLDWTYVSPAAFIQPGERTGSFRVGGTQLLTDAEGNSKISAEDFAIAIIDELENRAHVQEQITAAY